MEVNLERQSPDASAKKENCQFLVAPGMKLNLKMSNLVYGSWNTK